MDSDVRPRTLPGGGPPQLADADRLRALIVGELAEQRARSLAAGATSERLDRAYAARLGRLRDGPPRDG
jgi:hypothetical protein